MTEVDQISLVAPEKSVGDKCIFHTLHLVAHFIVALSRVVNDIMSFTLDIVNIRRPDAEHTLGYTDYYHFIAMFFCPTYQRNWHNGIRFFGK